MIYTVEKANLISGRLRKFTDSDSFIVAAQFANIDFWIEETVSTIKAIDEHNARFEKMCVAQQKWVEEKDVTIPNFCPICDGICELSQHQYKQPELPKNRARNEKKEARKTLIDAAYYFLIRCFRIGLLKETELKNYCNQIGTGVDFDDLEKD